MTSEQNACAIAHAAVAPLPGKAAAPSRYLFLYGTLMSGARGVLGTEERLRLARESDSLGPASLIGAHLYDLGHYPGVLLNGDLDAIVHGELVLLAKPQVTVLWLD